VWSLFAHKRQVSLTKVDSGVIGLAQFLPIVLLIFAAEHATDRFDRWRIATTCQIVEA
jgi:hypothetical protein